MFCLFLHLDYAKLMGNIIPQTCVEFCSLTADTIALYSPFIAFGEIVSCMETFAIWAPEIVNFWGLNVAEILLTDEEFCAPESEVGLSGPIKKYLNCIATLTLVVGNSCTVSETVCPKLAFKGEFIPPPEVS